MRPQLDQLYLKGHSLISFGFYFMFIDDLKK